MLLQVGTRMNFFAANAKPLSTRNCQTHIAGFPKKISSFKVNIFKVNSFESLSSSGIMFTSLFCAIFIWLFLDVEWIVSITYLILYSPVYVCRERQESVRRVKDVCLFLENYFEYLVLSWFV